jgi:hypothetical protein
VIEAGQSFLAYLPYGSEKEHLCLILTDEGGDLSTFFIVPVMTPKSTMDRTTMIGTTDHSFLKYDSCVVYAHLSEQDATSLTGKVLQWYNLKLDDKCLQAVIDGAIKSEDTPRGVRLLLKQRLHEQNP